MVDVLVDLQYGDCGKGKVSRYLNKVADTENVYDYIVKYNGGGNAGHSVFINDTEYVSHYLTSGIYNSKTKIIIGPGCVLNIKEFLDEMSKFKEFDVEDRVFIHPYTNIITDAHVLRDDIDGKIGSTKKGIGPCYSDKYARINKRAHEYTELSNYILKDLYWWNNDVSILMEGSQGWGLDIDWGNYPYVTSSHIHPAFAFATFGIPMHYAKTIYGVCKPYMTYVGSSENIVYCKYKEDEELIRHFGNEYGRTTNRPRKIGYLDINQLISAIHHTGVEILFINKCDVLENSNVFKLITPEDLISSFYDIESMKHYISTILFERTGIKSIYYGHSADGDSAYDIISKEK